MTSLATRAYRRPVSAEDVNELLQYYQDGVKEGGFEGGIRSAVTGLLASPFFLYRGEAVPAGLLPGETYAISDLELASKLSFFLWNSIPDDELLQLAINGTLSEPTMLDRQVRRLVQAHPGLDRIDEHRVEQEARPVVAGEEREDRRAHCGGDRSDEEDATGSDTIGDLRAAHERQRVRDLEGGRDGAGRRVRHLPLALERGQNGGVADVDHVGPDAREADGEEPALAARREAIECQRAVLMR